MATGFAAAVAASILNGLCRATNWTAPTEFWVKLHTGDPGAAGTSNAAGETTRKQGTFGTGASTSGSNETIANTVAMTWTAVSTSETYSHFSVWDASSGGNFQVSGTVTASAIASGNDFEVGIGDLVVNVPIAT